jgi:galactokinase
MPEVLKKRARHVVTENARVAVSVSALGSGRFRSLVNLSMRRTRAFVTIFEVSCRELDVMVEIARRQPGVLGSG